MTINSSYLTRLYEEQIIDIGFVWDEVKYQAVVNKHNVHFYEVVAAFDDPDGYELSDPAEHEDR